MTAAGRALFLIEHPHCGPSTWALLNPGTRDWWDAKAKPVAEAKEAEPDGP